MDARFKTFETNIKAEITATEKRTSEKLNEEIKASEERTVIKLNENIRSSEKRMTRRLDVIEYKIDTKTEDLDRRVERLEAKIM